MLRKQKASNGFAAYRDAVVHSMGAQKIDFAQYVKICAAAREGEQRYSPAVLVDSVKLPIYGNPDPERICTRHTERSNLTMRMQIRRLTRVTNGFSKKWRARHVRESRIECRTIALRSIRQTLKAATQEQQNA